MSFEHSNIQPVRSFIPPSFVQGAKKIPWMEVALAVGTVALITIALLAKFDVIHHVGSLSSETIAKMGFAGGGALGALAIAKFAISFYKKEKKPPIRKEECFVQDPNEMALQDRLRNNKKYQESKSLEDIQEALEDLNLQNSCLIIKTKQGCLLKGKALFVSQATKQMELLHPGIITDPGTLYYGLKEDIEKLDRQLNLTLGYISLTDILNREEFKGKIKTLKIHPPRQEDQSQ